MIKHSLLIALLFFSLAASSQVKFGVFIDPQITWMSPESKDVESQGNILGINGGLSIDKYFAKNYALNTGISIGTQGGKLKYDQLKTIEVYNTVDSLPAGSELEFNLKYLSIPLGLKLKSNQIGYLTYFVNLGFTNQINLNAKATSSEGSLDNDSIKEEINWYNLAYNFGGGVEYALGEDTALTLSVHYQNGFWDITNSDPEVYSRILSLRIGVLF